MTMHDRQRVPEGPAAARGRLGTGDHVPCAELQTAATSWGPRLGGTCAACDEGCPVLSAGAEASPLSGWTFAAAAAGTFLTPLLLGLGGALWFHGNHLVQWSATVSGLTLGMVLTALVARWLQRN